MKARFGDAILVLSLASNIALAYVIHRDRTPPAPPRTKGWRDGWDAHRIR